MHLSEFKAWFEGFTEEMKGTPTAAQWKKICQRVAEITNDYTPAPIIIDRYIKPYRPYYPQIWWESVTPRKEFTRDDWSTIGKAEFTCSTKAD